MRMHPKQLFISSLLFTCLIVSAQNKPQYFIGIHAGTFIYHGDLSPWKSGSWKTPAFVWGLTGHRMMSTNFSLRMELNFGKLRGDEARYVKPEYRQQRAFAFNSQVTEVIMAIEWTPLEKRTRLRPYVFAGTGYSGLRITRDYSRFNPEYFTNEPTLVENFQRDISTPLPRGVLIFPIGIGLRYAAVNSNLSFQGEAAHRFTRSDYIDGFSLAANPELKDSYTKYSIGLRYALGNKDPYACPPIRF